MKLVLRDYLASISESCELDLLVADLLLNMNIEPLTKPQRGPRQDGVDIAAVGVDLNDNKRKLFLITIKSGDITRSKWNGGNTNDVRPSLDEIKDVYLTSRVDISHQELPKKIILCCGGILKQEADYGWKGYVKTNNDVGRLEYALWTGDTLALLIEEYFMDEYLFPHKNQSLMRKSLALLDQNEMEPVFFYRLIDQILFESDLTRYPSQQLYTKHHKVLRLVHLCLNVLFRWALDVENIRPALLSAERTLLKTWDFLRQHDLLRHNRSIKIFIQMYEKYFETSLIYAKRISSTCFVEDGLANLSNDAESLEYPLRVYEVIGFLSILGIIQFDNTSETVINDSDFNELRAVDVLLELLKNNSVSNTPRYDGHGIEIASALLLLRMNNHVDDALNWMRELYLNVTNAYRLRNYFPISTDNYEDLIDLELGQGIPPEHLMNLSTLLPMIAEWYAIIGNQEEYSKFRETVNNSCKNIDLQIWYPDIDTESLIYSKFAARQTGVTCTSISLPEDLDKLRETIRTRFQEYSSASQLSCITHNFPILSLIASRHYRTPVIPDTWQRLISETDNL